MREFHEVIFLGSPHSKQLRQELHDRLDEAIDMLGGLQQPDHPESKEHARQCEADRIYWEAQLSDAIMDLRVALGDNTAVTCSADSQFNIEGTFWGDGCGGKRT